jgi:hypothetical protein
MLRDGGVDEQSLRLLVREEVVEGRIEKGGVQVELLSVFVTEGWIRVHDPDKLSIGLLRKLLEKADDVAVFKADNGNANRGGLSEQLRSRKSRDDDGNEQGNCVQPDAHAFMLPP